MKTADTRARYAAYEELLIVGDPVQVRWTVAGIILVGPGVIEKVSRASFAVKTTRMIKSSLGDKVKKGTRILLRRLPSKNRTLRHGVFPIDGIDVPSTGRLTRARVRLPSKAPAG